MRVVLALHYRVYMGGVVERSIELLAGIQFLIIGLSHLVQPRVWVAFFIALREKGLAGVFANGFLSLLFGSLIVAFHNVWTGLPVMLTVIGWSQVVKAMVSFVAHGWRCAGSSGLQSSEPGSFRSLV
jgi:hypothetical protein